MAKYTGPVFKKSRRYGFSILESGKEFAKGKRREYAPGQHGDRRRKLSDYGLHLYEKQKVRYMYGLNERQFRRTFSLASKTKGVLGTQFLITLEKRLDNVVYRLGFAKTRREARQLVNHNHFTLNGKKANIPSMQVQINDVIELKAKTHKNVQIEDSMSSKQVAPWLTRKGFKGTFDRFPERNELNKEINESLIVEHYNK